MNLLVGGPLPARSVFWPAKTRKNLNFSRCIHVFDLVINYCLDIIRGNWQQALFYFTALMGNVGSLFGMFFSSMLQVVY